MKKGLIDLRSYSHEDHNRTYDWLQDPQIRRMTGTTAAPKPETHVRWFETMQARKDVVMWAIYFNGQHIGSFYLVDIDHINKRAEIQMFLGPMDIRGKGIGTQVIAMIDRYAFNELGLHRLYGWPFENNTPSIRMLQSNGWEIEGVLRDHRFVDGQPVNVLVMGLLNRNG